MTQSYEVIAAPLSTEWLLSGSVAARSPATTRGLVGRARELAHLARGLAEVPVAVIYGLPGIGKSVLAAGHAATWSGCTSHLALAAGASIAHLAQAIGAPLGAAPGEIALDDAARLEALWAVTDRAEALVVLDDLHHLDPAVRGRVLDSASQHLRSGRLIATSRELVPIRAGMPDRLELRLEGLDRADAAQLWDRLLELYGPGGDFEAAWARSFGHPVLLRRAHVRTRSSEDPVLAIVRALDPAQRRVAGALALSQVALPLGAVARLGAGSASALDALVNQLLVDEVSEASYAMHDPAREVVVAQLGGAQTAELCAALIDALSDGAVGAVTRLQESARHLRALGRHADLDALVIALAPRLIAQGATDALVREILRDGEPGIPGRPAHDIAAPVAARPLVSAQVRTALRAACAATASRELPSIDVAIPPGAGHAFDRALLELARAVLATRQGRVRRAAKHVESAVKHAAQCHADPALVPALHAHLRSQIAAVPVEPSPRAPQAELVIDGERHEIIDGSLRVDLASRLILRKLLYAFVTAEGHCLDHSAIARALWRSETAASCRNSSLKSNIRRLRELLEGTRLMIQTDHDGYRLVIPPGCVIVPPRS